MAKKVKEVSAESEAAPTEVTTPEPEVKVPTAEEYQQIMDSFYGEGERQPAEFQIDAEGTRQGRLLLCTVKDLTNGTSITVPRKDFIVFLFNKDWHRGWITELFGLAYQNIFINTKGLQNKFHKEGATAVAGNPKKAEDETGDYNLLDKEGNIVEEKLSRSAYITKSLMAGVKTRKALADELGTTYQNIYNVSKGLDLPEEAKAKKPKAEKEPKAPKEKKAKKDKSAAVAAVLDAPSGTESDAGLEA